MKTLQSLKEAKTKPQLAKILGIKPSTLTHCLYVLNTNNQYIKFEIPKKNGGIRVIHAPTPILKMIQKSLSKLLLNCLDEIIFTKFPNSELARQKAKNSGILKVKISNAEIKQPSLSHGFERNRSIITNAMMHLDKKFVFNIDLHDFFGSFNFGRVRGYFIKNRNFELHPDIATVIAKIACYQNKLPQGSPCSPVISNLITHALDIKLAKLAKLSSSTYTRYADDITFSTRLSELPKSIAEKENHKYEPSKKITKEINRSGFSINTSKTRNQYADSRQDVTGLIVNKKPNTKKEYCRLARSQCNHLFKRGEFKELINGNEEKGNINSLEGKLNFIDQIDHYNRLRQTKKLNPKYQLKKDTIKNGNAKLRRYLHSSREKTFSQFIFYRHFYGNELPTILTEGKTDNVYLKSAINKLSAQFPELSRSKTSQAEYKLLLKFFNYNERTRFLLELFGGTDYLRDFIVNYKKNFSYYQAPKPKKPVIILVDNDSGPRDLINYAKNIEGVMIYPAGTTEIRDADFVHIFHNLYLVLTPKKPGHNETDIELFFKDVDRLRIYNGKHFNTAAQRDKNRDLSKEAFAEHVIHAQKDVIDFSEFPAILERLVKAMNHYDTIK
ncbi:retron Ec67 family RNA-directed DNA polymerase/endonuclease [Erwinia sp. Leaf53]|uniref:retron Ec67 family RNA-directed DNA polymerase/endonuclease n=1 Tax=Erwinia sp. Leaf53 TaxID=1736225 RepID=UPI0006F61D36|nr:retron Ec67 family RNA-directed DNA polymerase/endonuclease [Erwinia sp. Leaf53]KQN63615.1 ribonuclease H [Erwinia sp. Leaf53]